jgi:hypothetical protein
MALLGLAHDARNNPGETSTTSTREQNRRRGRKTRHAKSDTAVTRGIDFMVARAMRQPVRSTVAAELGISLLGTYCQPAGAFCWIRSWHENSNSPASSSRGLGLSAIDDKGVAKPFATMARVMRGDVQTISARLNAVSVMLMAEN